MSNARSPRALVSITDGMITFSALSMPLKSISGLRLLGIRRDRRGRFRRRPFDRRRRWLLDLRRRGRPLAVLRRDRDEPLERAPRPQVAPDRLPPLRLPEQLPELRRLRAGGRAQALDLRFDVVVGHLDLLGVRDLGEDQGTPDASVRHGPEFLPHLLFGL